MLREQSSHGRPVPHVGHQPEVPIGKRWGSMLIRVSAFVGHQPEVPIGKRWGLNDRNRFPIIALDHLEPQVGPGTKSIDKIQLVKYTVTVPISLRPCRRQSG